jgi:hypothetical protein
MKDAAESLSRGAVDHDIDVQAKVYENGKVAGIGNTQAAEALFTARD